ncbi:MAG: hypothetical protein JSV82_08415 [Planctomycetota bacterium]|nr:MAG: hypothetical protein JSV82_08415 [Planctomycetota bacterium]
MAWVIIIIAVLICAYLLVARVYTTKSEKTKEMPKEDAQEYADDDAETGGDE